LARHMGADEALDPSAIDVVRQIQSETGGRGVDCVIDCAAKELTTNQAIRMARNAGRVVITGIHSGTHVPFEVSPMRRKELAILNVRRSNHETPAALAMLAERAAFFAPLLTHTRPLGRIAEAFSIAGSYSDGVGKMIVTAP
jgi:L-iditol 2-dehydrogenase